MVDPARGGRARRRRSAAAGGLRAAEGGPEVPRARRCPASTNVIGSNATQPPTDNKLVRQALNYAIDRKRIVEHRVPRAGRAADAAVAADTRWRTTPEAGRLSVRSRQGEGAARRRPACRTWSSTSHSTPRPPSGRGGADLSSPTSTSLGIKANIKPYEPAAYLDQINNHKYTGIYVGSIAYASIEPVTIIGNSRHLDPTGNSNTGYTSEQYSEAVVDRFDRAGPGQAQGSSTAQINDLILDESCVMPICSAPARMLTAARSTTSA